MIGASRWYLCIFGKSKDGLRHHFDRLGTDFPAAPVAVRNADSGKKEPQVIIDFRDGPYGGTGILTGYPLFDGDCGGEAFNGLYIGFVHLADNCRA